MAFGLLEVQLVNAKGLRSTDLIGDIDPYVLIQYKNQERKSSVAQDDGTCPVWNQRLTFRVEYPVPDGQYKLILKIMDKDTFSTDDCLGQAVIYLKDLLEIGMERGTAEIHPRKYSVVLPDQTYCGEIQVGVTFTLQEGTGSGEEIFGGWKESDY